jgi:hypothetical protein
VTGLSPSDWVQVSGDAAITTVAAISAFFAWRLARIALDANRVSARLLETSHRVQLDARLPRYVLTCDYFHWSPPQPGEVDDGEYTMTWRIQFLGSQPARLSIFRPADLECDISFDGHPVTGPLHVATQLGQSHTITWRARIESASAPPGMQATIRLDDFVETVADMIRLTAVWSETLAPVMDVERVYPQFDIT